MSLSHTPHGKIRIVRDGAAFRAQIEALQPEAPAIDLAPIDAESPEAAFDRITGALAQALHESQAAGHTPPSFHRADGIRQPAPWRFGLSLDFLVTPAAQRDRNVTRADDGRLVVEIFATFKMDRICIQIETDGTVICWSPGLLTTGIHRPQTDGSPEVPRPGLAPTGPYVLVVEATSTVDLSGTDLLPEDLIREILASDDLAWVEEQVTAHFWSNINPALTDPLLDGDDPFLQGDPFRFTAGNEAALRESLTHILFEDPALEGETHVEVEIDAEGDYEIWGLDCPSVLTPETQEAIRAAIVANPFNGHTMEYNDGAAGRQSGFSPSPARISLDIERPTAHARARHRRHKRETAETPASAGTR